ncbi:hypothetical protein A2331_05980 [Candidatus Falkowbacteria bacterium RIFOXYB2_FULL_34_18]|uniref:Uncharacterized protein n=1 Tax=Candidatus Falkowbacteria bacterium RIFOXYD2_FULL_34_120 TaxID=1798007 RepID=A0A1F5TPI8_9BACT|nr:MAG: hypothetical protein A2331_05980 [Candidatus Falkowbacteria bacterium RIFOXYB2_FULL_34_18]OGF29063.1 MAG: hypothetical protein A2500_03415 [Candidatus Falkowbacteria bacterium RIFOXYC12_FULL_34_55]OGF36127.1 MAG: hypothetical protein A2466_03555 [Candidatus Falkowbacteria bacterium RIFOXYC2_FULL_34_220]OGF38579.1 MAG: hypothetical protein A2515_04815 [Candidatus Falkowbacteria bacterium RIFOXYD12_FULL_34_57]OGF40748.1 MAG: hypothetical protein A2531_06940 [Candidatus Falkowbacteria bact
MALKTSLLKKIDETGEKKRETLSAIKNFIRDIYEKLSKNNLEFFEITHRPKNMSFSFIKICIEENNKIYISIFLKSMLVLEQHDDQTIEKILKKLEDLSLQNINDLYSLINEKEENLEIKIC